MADSGDEVDSRTAAVGASRPRAKPSSQHSDSSSRPAKKPRLNGAPDNREVKEFVPRGAAFSAQSLEVDPEETSSSGSSQDSSDDEVKDVPVKSTAANPNAGNTAPAVSWNQAKKTPVRTTLGGRKASQPAPSQFNAVNDAYWRTGSASVSSENRDSQGEGDNTSSEGDSDSEEDDSDSSGSPGSDGEQLAKPQPGTKQNVPGDHARKSLPGQKASQASDSSDLEEGEVDSASESEDSESLGSGGDAIMLNIGTEQKAPEGVMDAHVQNALAGSAKLMEPSSKEEASRAFAQKYPAAPVSLVDLTTSDLQTQGIFVYWDQKLETLDLQLPVGCIECLKTGHLADICPTKECTHCGKWDAHPSAMCPTWRRCQRCRERGHDEENCSSSLKSSAAEVPCDLCGSSQHLENHCDYHWRFPMREPISSTVKVSISCAHCVSSNHLIGDCPSLPSPLNTTLFSLNGIDNANIVNISGPAKSAPPPNRPAGAPKGPRRRGGRDRSPSSGSDGMPSRGRRRPPPPGRGNRGAIRFGNGTASGGSRGRPQPLPARPQPANGTSRGGRGASQRARGNRARGNGRGGRGRGGR